MELKTKVYGDYVQVATTAQSIKAVLRQGKNWSSMALTQVEALENIATHLARIIEGDAGYQEHWESVTAHSQAGTKTGQTSLPQVERDLSTILKAAAQGDAAA
ncbi:hypothetical protein EB093_08715 [bacterium]|nr:hypothetical protein [bacterium]